MSVVKNRPSIPTGPIDDVQEHAQTRGQEHQLPLNNMLLQAPPPINSNDNAQDNATETLPNAQADNTNQPTLESQDAIIQNQQTQRAIGIVEGFNAAIDGIAVATNEVVQAEDTPQQQPAANELFVDAPVFEFLQQVQSQLSTPLENDIRSLWARLETLLNHEVDLPNDDRFAVIQEQIINVKLEIMDAILESEQIGELENAVHNLNHLSLEEFHEQVDSIVRVAWTNTTALESNETLTNLRANLKDKIGQLVLKFIPENLRSEETNNASVLALFNLKGISSQNIGNIVEFCLDFQISFEEALTTLSSAAKSIKQLHTQTTQNKEQAKQQALADLNGKLEALSVAIRTDGPLQNRLHTVDDIFRYNYPTSSNIALQLKNAMLAPNDGASLEGIKAQHDLVQAIQDLKALTEHSGILENIRTRHNTINHAIATSSHDYPGFLTPDMVESFSNSEIDNLSFRLAHIALLQMQAHEGGALEPMFSGDGDSVDWQSAQTWCEHLKLPQAAASMVTGLEDEQLNDGDLFKLSLKNASELFGKGIEGKTGLITAMKSVQSTSKIMNVEVGRITSLFSSMDPKSDARHALRVATLAHLHGLQSESVIQTIQSGDIQSLNEEIKQMVQTTLRRTSRGSEYDHVTSSGYKRRNRILHELRSQEEDDFLVVRARIAEKRQIEAADNKLLSEIRFFAPYLGRERQQSSQAIIKVDNALELYRRDPSDENKQALRTALEGIGNINPNTLKRTTNESLSFAAYVRNFLDNDSNEAALNEIGTLLEIAAPRARVMQKYAPYKDIDPYAHGRTVTFLRSIGNSFKSGKIHDVASLFKRNIKSTAWRVADVYHSPISSLLTKISRVPLLDRLSSSKYSSQSEMIRNLVRMSLALNFLNSDATPNSAFKLTDSQTRADVLKTLKDWGLNINDTETKYLINRSILNYTHADSSINVQGIKSSSQTFGRMNLRRNPSGTQIVDGQTIRRTSIADLKASASIANSEGITAMLNTLSEAGGSVIYNRQRGVSFDSGAYKILSTKGKKRTMAPASLTLEGMRDKSIAISKIGDKFQVIIKNQIKGSVGGSYKTGIGAGFTVAGGVNISGHRAAGIGLTFTSKEACENFLQRISHAQTVTKGQEFKDNIDDVVHGLSLDTLVSGASEIHYLNEKGFSINAMGSLSFSALSVEIGRSTHGLNASFAVAIGGGCKTAHRKNSQGEEISFTRHFAINANISAIYSRAKDTRGIIGEEQGTMSMSPIPHASFGLGKVINVTYNVQTRGHDLLPGTNREIELPNTWDVRAFGFPAGIKERIASNPIAQRDFALQSANKPTSWTIRYSIKPEALSKARELMAQARSCFDPDKASKLSSQVHKILANDESYEPAAIVAKFPKRDVLSNLGIALISLQATSTTSATRVNVGMVDLRNTTPRPEQP